MNVESLLNLSSLPIGEVITVEGVLMENTNRPYLGRTTLDWISGRCIFLTDDGIFDRLLDLLFPYTIVGGNTFFLYQATAVGRLSRNVENDTLVLTELRSFRVKIGDKVFTL